MEDTSDQLTGSMDIKQRLMSLNVSDRAAAKEWFRARRQKLRPWGIFVNTAWFKMPRNPPELTQRIVRNVDHFLSNYLFVFIGLALYCLLTSPLLLVALAAALGACYILRLKNAQSTLRILGQEVAPAHQYAAVFLCSFPLFYLAGAGAAVFWVIGASFFIILMHASFFSIESLPMQEEQPDVETV